MGGSALQAHLNTTAFESVVEALEATTFASSARETLPGASGFSLQIGGPWSKTLDDIVRPDVISPGTMRTLVYFVGPSASRVTYTWTAAGNVGAFFSNYTITADDPMGDIQWSATLTVSGAPVVS